VTGKPPARRRNRRRERSDIGSRPRTRPYGLHPHDARHRHRVNAARRIWVQPSDLSRAQSSLQAPTPTRSRLGACRSGFRRRSRTDRREAVHVGSTRPITPFAESRIGRVVRRARGLGCRHAPRAADLPATMPYFVAISIGPTTFMIHEYYNRFSNADVVPPAACLSPRPQRRQA